MVQRRLNASFRYWIYNTSTTKKRLDDLDNYLQRLDYKTFKTVPINAYAEHLIVPDEYWEKFNQEILVSPAGSKL